MTRALLVAWIAAGLSATVLCSCKGETKLVDRPETMEALAGCRTQVEEKDNYINILNKRLADLELEGTRLVVRIEGDDMVIDSSSASSKPTGPATNADVKKLTSSFLGQVQDSRGAMKKCYQGALKKNTALQARAVKLDVSVQFNGAGEVAQTRFSPRISDEFTACMTTVAKRWALAGAPAGVTFEQTVELSPQ